MDSRSPPWLHCWFGLDGHASELWKAFHCFVNLKMRDDGVKSLFDFSTVACFPTQLFNRGLMNTLLPLHYVALSSFFSPLGDVLWRFPEFCCSLLCISFLSRQTVQHEPLCLCQGRTWREDFTSPSLQSFSCGWCCCPSRIPLLQSVYPTGIVGDSLTCQEVMLVLPGVIGWRKRLEH